ncbi:hypothetical protein [Parasphingorhabdus cellanae]|uniref:EpsG family protein n=1 Tax=Parasphingorhabdus cellanae TaxID=2806553 RepID=A0ABX7SZY6_9SPHN|nr:hypothetical protein [Parasphingorhabdus cellanae]QTD54856.1 hypothetical protein J4G78_11410 [Parasphingorhabdus cellanae]
MLDLTIRAETLLNLEIFLQIAIMASLAVWIAFFRTPIRSIVLIFAIIIFMVGGFRPENYNSDTRNYASYFHFLSLKTGSSLYTLTKIEPIHVFLVSISQSFRIWLILEGLAASILAILLYIKIKRTDVFCVIIALSSTLYTSSFRFALSMLLFSWLLSKYNRSYISLGVISLLSSLAHVVMLMGGILAKRKPYIPILLVALFYLASLYDEGIRERSGADLQDIKTTGLRSFAAGLLVIFYTHLEKGKVFNRVLLIDLTNITILFLSTAFLFPFLNRLIIVFTLVVALDFANLNKYTTLTIRNRLFALVIYMIIAVPYIYLVPPLFYTNRW